MGTIYGYGPKYGDPPPPPRDKRTDEEKAKDDLRWKMKRHNTTRDFEKSQALLHEILWKKCKTDINALKDPEGKSIAAFTRHQLEALLKGENVPLIQPDGSADPEKEYRFPSEELTLSRTTPQLLQNALVSTAGPIDITIAKRLIRAIDEAPQSEVIETVGSVVKEKLALFVQVASEEASR